MSDLTISSFFAAIAAHTAALEAHTAALTAAGGAGAAAGAAKADTAKTTTAKTTTAKTTPAKADTAKPKHTRPELIAILNRVKEEHDSTTAKELIKEHGKADKLAEVDDKLIDTLFNAAETLLGGASAGSDEGEL